MGDFSSPDIPALATRISRRPSRSLSELDQLLRVRHFTKIGLARFDAGTVLSGFLLDLRRCFAIALVAEDHVRAGLREKFYGGRADAARTTRYECCFARERNHVAPKEIKI